MAITLFAVASNTENNNLAITKAFVVGAQPAVILWLGEKEEAGPRHLSGELIDV
jgi:hypothetical protein